MRVYDKDGNVVYPFQWHNALKDRDGAGEMVWMEEDYFHPVSAGDRLRDIRRDNMNYGHHVMRWLAWLVLAMLAIIMLMAWGNDQ